jgi:hypothetical protein
MGSKEELVGEGGGQRDETRSQDRQLLGGTLRSKGGYTGER